MIVGLDFDRVLFKTDEFKEFLDDEVSGFLEHYPDKGHYDPELHAERIGVDAERINETLKHSDDFTYNDVDSLEDLREDFKLVIVSRGDPYFQERKIVNSGVLEHVDGFFIVEDKPKDSIDIDFLVEDREKELEDVSVPGFIVDRDKHDTRDIVEAVQEWAES